jgi:hypothetical protein
MIKVTETPHLHAKAGYRNGYRELAHKKEGGSSTRHSHSNTTARSAIAGIGHGPRANRVCRWSDRCRSCRCPHSSPLTCYCPLMSACVDCQDDNHSWRRALMFSYGVPVCTQGLLWCEMPRLPDTWPYFFSTVASSKCAMGHKGGFSCVLGAGMEEGGEGGWVAPAPALFGAMQREWAWCRLTHARLLVRRLLGSHRRSA